MMESMDKYLESGAGLVAQLLRFHQAAESLAQLGPLHLGPIPARGCQGTAGGGSQGGSRGQVQAGGDYGVGLHLGRVANHHLQEEGSMKFGQLLEPNSG